MDFTTLAKKANHLSMSLRNEEFYRDMRISIVADLIMKTLKDRKKALEFAVTRGYPEMVQRFLAKEDNLDSLLILASEEGNLGVAKFFVEVGVKPDEKALLAAAKNHHFQVMKYILSITTFDLPRQSSILVGLVVKQDLNSLEFLVENGFEVGKDSCELLASSVMSKDKEIVKFLLDRKININCSYGWPLAEAIEGRFFDIADLLIERGADADAAYKRVSRSLVGRDDFEMLKFLIDRGAQVNFRNQAALRWAIERGTLDMVKYFMEKGAKLRPEFVELALTKNSLDKIEYLLAQDIDIRPQSSTILRKILKLRFSEEELVELLDLLKRHGVDIHIDDDFLFKFAINNNHIYVIKYMIENGSDDQLLLESAETPLSLTSTL